MTEPAYPTLHSTSTPVEPGKRYWLTIPAGITVGTVQSLFLNEDHKDTPWVVTFADTNDQLQLSLEFGFHESAHKAISHWNEMQEDDNDNRP